MTKAKRNVLVEKYQPLVKAVVGKFKAQGLPPYIEADDLEQCGYIALIEAIETSRRSIPASERIERSIRTAIIREIDRERSHWPCSRVAMEDLNNGLGEPTV